MKQSIYYLVSKYQQEILVLLIPEKFGTRSLQKMQGDPLPVISVFRTPINRVLFPVTHLEGHL